MRCIPHVVVLIQYGHNIKIVMLLLCVWVLHPSIQYVCNIPGRMRTLEMWRVYKRCCFVMSWLEIEIGWISIRLMSIVLANAIAITEHRAFYHRGHFMNRIHARNISQFSNNHKTYTSRFPRAFAPQRRTIKTRILYTDRHIRIASLSPSHLAMCVVRCVLAAHVCVTYTTSLRSLSPGKWRVYAPGFRNRAKARNRVACVRKICSQSR